MKKSKLARTLDVDEQAIAHSLEELERNLDRRGIALLRKDDEVSLGTSPEAAQIIERLAKEELSKELGRAALETVSIVLYRGPIAKSEIDYIRGVNSHHILRNLLVRGLVERVENPNLERSFLYRASFDLLEHLGITRIEDLPEYDIFREKVAQAMAEHS